MLLGFALLCQHHANATGFTYEFSQTYNANSDAAIFGTSATFDITFDNGGQTNLNQTFNWTDVTQITLNTAGGIFNGTFNPTLDLAGGVNPFLTTDNNGNGAFIFNNQVNEYLIGSLTTSQGVLNIQLGTYYFDNIALSIDLALFGTHQFAYYEPSSINPPNYVFAPASWTAPANYIGSSTVPIPAAIWLFGTTLLGFIGLKRRKH